MHVFLAQPRGFCAGVTRAIDIVEKALSMFGPPVYVRHEIVHNRHVVADLRAKGAVFVASVDEIPEGATTVFSAHGVSDAVEQAAQSRDLPVIDATCPLVSKVHREGKRFAEKGYEVVLIGHAGHPEIEGTRGRIPVPVHLISELEDVAALKIAAETPVAYITQTTLSVDDTRDTIAALKARFPHIEGQDTKDICYATQNRQTAARALAERVELLLVVGAANSSNTNRLREIGDKTGIPSYRIDDGEAIDPAWLDGVERVGITAGASAPEALVEAVIARLHALSPDNFSLESLEGVEEDVEFRLPRPLRESRRVAAE